MMWPARIFAWWIGCAFGAIFGWIVGTAINAAFPDLVSVAFQSGIMAGMFAEIFERAAIRLLHPETSRP